MSNDLFDVNLLIVSSLPSTKVDFFSFNGMESYDVELLLRIINKKPSHGSIYQIYVFMSDLLQLHYIYLGNVFIEIGQEKLDEIFSKKLNVSLCSTMDQVNSLLSLL